MAYSFSQMKLIHQCPYKYKKLYIDKVKEPSGIHAVFGQAIHHVYKDAIVNNWERKEAIDVWKHYFEVEMFNNAPTMDDPVEVFDSLQWWNNRGYPAIQLFYNKLESFDIKKIIAIEQKMSGEFDGEKFNFVCDLIYLNSEGERVIIDYKTGKEKEVDYLQIVFYDGRFEQLCDKVCLFYIWSGPIWIKREDYLAKSDEYVRQGLAIAKAEKYERIFNKYCKSCMFYADDCSKVK